MHGTFRREPKQTREYTTLGKVLLALTLFAHMGAALVLFPFLLLRDTLIKPAP